MSVQLRQVEGRRKLTLLTPLDVFQILRHQCCHHYSVDLFLTLNRAAVMSGGPRCLGSAGTEVANLEEMLEEAEEDDSDENDDNDDDNVEERIQVSSCKIHPNRRGRTDYILVME